ncbi:MAG: hypothetical protein R6X34_18025 [Chloroflexota bacterium]
MKWLKKQSKVMGKIGLYNLSDWWLTTFTEAEQCYIAEKYQPMGAPEGSLIKGELQPGETGRAAQLLWGLATWFSSKEDFTIACRILDKAEELSSNPIDYHFTYSGMIHTYYPMRDVEPEALAKTIEACQAQINIASEVAQHMREDRARLAIFVSRPFQNSSPSDIADSEIEAVLKKSDYPLPSHEGYKQMSIILEKQGNFSEVIRLAQQAKQQGWKGDWDKRIDRCEKKLGNMKK